MNYTGFLNVYKEKGMTSMSVCARIRRILHVDKTGHAGTLDPMAEGVLPVALGRATKSVSEVGDGTKTYEAGLLLGITTDTEDITGKVLSRYSGSLPSGEEIRKAISSFVGGYDQLTPMYSARQVDGRRLYDIARSGEEVERPRKRIEIRDIVITEVNPPHVKFTVTCSKGTYIRTLCSDIGELLSCGACMESLRRTAVGDFTAEDALSFSDIEKLYEEGRIDEAIRVVTPTAVAIGKFDGTHIGHRALLRELRKAAEKHRLRSLVLIIEPEGKTVQEKEERRETLLSLGIDYVIELPLTDQMMHMSAEDFMTEILIKKLSMKYLVGGKDISFGYQKRGNEEFLRTHAAEYGFHFRLIEKVELAESEDRELSSTRLRKELFSGNMETVTRIMGRPYAVTGTVTRGNHIGTDILGIPTVNVPVPEGMETPPYGVYAVRVTVFGKEDKNVRNDHTAPKGKNAEKYDGICNLGVKPTVPGENPLGLESFLFAEPGQVPELYDRTVKTELLHFIRAEKKFPDFSSLEKELREKDIPAAVSFFEKSEN